MVDLKWDNQAIKEEILPRKKTTNGFQTPDNINELILLAKVAEQAERYDEMAVCMRKVVKLNSTLDMEGRNLLSVAYKNIIGQRRTSWRILSAIENREQERGAEDNLKTISVLKKQCEVELGDICNDLLSLLDGYLINAELQGEPLVFYLKMKGDYHRYFAEAIFSQDQSNAALKAYEKAMQAAKETLLPTNPIRLGLVLNFSVFHYEIMKQYETGFKLASQAYDEAVVKLESLNEEEYRESHVIVQLLRDNVTLWSEDMQE